MYALLPYGSCLQLVTNLRDIKSSALHNKNKKAPDGIFIAQYRHTEDYIPIYLVAE